MWCQSLVEARSGSVMEGADLRDAGAGGDLGRAPPPAGPCAGGPRAASRRRCALLPVPRRRAEDGPHREGTASGGRGLD